MTPSAAATKNQIIELEENGTIALVKLVPRIDFAKLSSKAAGHEQPKAAFGRRKGAERPPARLFNADEVHEYDQVRWGN